MSSLALEDVLRDFRVHRTQIAEAIAERKQARRRDLAAEDGERSRSRWLQEAYSHVDYLAAALAFEEPVLFVDYVAWARIMLAWRNISSEDLASALMGMCEVLRSELAPGAAEVAVACVSVSLPQLASELSEPPSFLSDDGPLSSVARAYLGSLLAGERRRASELVLKSVEGGTSVADVYLHVFQPCQHEIGRLWQIHAISAAQEHFCTAGTQLVMSQLYPYVFASERRRRTLLATCVEGDLHEIGVRMVSDLFELDGWDTTYLGASVPIGSIVETVRKQRPDLLCVSATIAPHLWAVESLIREVRARPELGSTKILVGGYPFNIAPDLWRRLGADGSAKDAAASVALGNWLVSGQPS